MGEPNKTIKCRVCLRYDNKVSAKCLSIFEIINGCSISEKVNIIANVNIKKGDGFPDKICPDCLLQLENAMSFKQKCEASNKFLLSSVYNSNTELPSHGIKEEAVELGNDSDDDFTDFEGKAEFLHEDDTNETSTATKNPNYSWPEITIPITDVENFVKSESTSSTEELVEKSTANDLGPICDDCGGSFKSKCKLRVHWKKVHQPERLLCPICKRQFKTFRAFNQHKKKGNVNCRAASKVHIEGQGKNRVFHCKECNYKTPNIRCMGAHLVVHTGDRPFKCKDCPKTFPQYAAMSAHREYFHKEYKMALTCHVCGKQIPGRVKFYRHLKMHRQQSLQCKVCNKMLKGKQNLAHHMQRHSGVRSYSCEVCAASFYTVGELSNHRTRVHATPEKSFKCHLCEYRVKTKCSLKKHTVKHNGTNVVCFVCGQFAENAEKLALHQRKHFEKHIECTQCDKKFHNKKARSKHMCKYHRFTMVVNKREDKPSSTPTVKEETTHKKEGFVLLSPPSIIIK